MKHIVHVLEATAGGTLRHVRELSGALNPKRFKQTLVLKNSPAWEQDAPATFFISMAHEISPWKDFIAFIKLTRMLGQLKPDIVHAHSSKAGALARMACAVLRVPCVYTPHAFSFLDTTLSKKRRAFYRTVEKFLARFTSVLIAVSREEARITREKLGLQEARVRLIPNGVRLPTNDERRTASEVASRSSEVGSPKSSPSSDATRRKRGWTFFCKRWCC